MCNSSNGYKEKAVLLDKNLASRTIASLPAQLPITTIARDQWWRVRADKLDRTGNASPKQEYNTVLGLSDPTAMDRHQCINKNSAQIRVNATFLVLARLIQTV